MNILVVILGSIGGAFLLLFGVWLSLKKVVTLQAKPEKHDILWKHKKSLMYSLVIQMQINR